MMLQLLQKHLACFDVSSPLQYHLKELHWNTYLDQIFQMNFSQTMEINLTIHHPYLKNLASINIIVISIIIITIIIIIIIIVITITVFSRSSTVEQLRHPRTLCNMTMPSDTKIFTPFLFTPFTPKPSVQFETTGVFVKFLLKLRGLDQLSLRYHWALPTPSSREPWRVGLFASMTTSHFTVEQNEDMQNCD